MAKSSVEILRELYQETFIDNNSGQITPAKHRAFLEALITIMANGEQGNKADSAVQRATLGSATVSKEGDTLSFPAYPTTLPNPNSLKIKQNGGIAAEYTGENPLEVNITPEGIKAMDQGLYIRKATMTIFSSIGQTSYLYRSGYMMRELPGVASIGGIEFIEGTDVVISFGGPVTLTNLQMDVIINNMEDVGFSFFDYANNINWGVTLLPYRSSSTASNSKLVIRGFSFKPSNQGIYRITLNNFTV